MTFRFYGFALLVFPFLFLSLRRETVRKIQKITLLYDCGADDCGAHKQDVPHSR